ncbi:methyltransferase domain-containing protein [Asanoa sp. NPDC050611]|uniref:methyltransferase domain-containing protein n=1 Tax=Asanoa sp. NPDC050611 TaxID=3157098 RepID=UPI0033EE38EC
MSTALGLLSDHQLGHLVATAPAVGSGVGGTSALLHVEDVPVFAKRIALTDLERQPQHVMSTANIFELPMFCHYGVVAYGGNGFGVWRELAANVMTTNWVLAQRTAAFPLMYHWRVLPGAPPLDDEIADIDKVVDYWAGSAAVRRRLQAVEQASASVVLFLEHIPQRLDAWLAGQLAAGRADAACATVRRTLRADVAFLNDNGLLHFDAHFRNILTDGDRLYLADFGLATSSRFDLSTEERDFVARNKDHDAAYAMRELHNWMVANGVETLEEHEPVVAVINDFYWNFYGESRETPYPAKEIGEAMGKVDYDARLHAVYTKGRQMSPDALRTWLDAFARHLPATRPLTWLDLGSGTGRLTPGLADAFGGPVHGIEPSDRMRAQAAEHPAVTYAAGSAERIPLPDAACDAALLFFVWHHVVDHAAAARELRRVVKPGGTLFVQANFADRMPDTWWFRVVPEWRAIDAAQFRSQAQVKSDFTDAGWALVGHDQVTWQRSPSLAADVERLKLRAVSAFELMSAETVEAGFARIEAALPSLEDGPQYETNDLLVFRRVG